MQNKQAETRVRQWLEEVVIGLNLCPFASKPYLDQRVRIQASDCDNETCLLEVLKKELDYLAQQPPEKVETTLLVVTAMLGNFYDYNDFLDLAERLLEQLDYTGTIQIASFHPGYQFAGTEPEDCENLTNRAPYPILHLIRETSLEKALKHYPHPEQIPERNIDTVCGLSNPQRQALFPHLYSHNG